MSIDEALDILKNIKEKKYSEWTFPLKLGPHDAIAADLIELARERLGDNATAGDLLDVVSSAMWWTMAFLSLGEPPKPVPTAAPVPPGPEAGSGAEPAGE